LEDEKVNIVVPPGQKWIMKRAIELYRFGKEQTAGYFIPTTGCQAGFEWGRERKLLAALFAQDKKFR
jgi:hypothetical protein